MILSDTYVLRKSSVYADAKQTGDYLPIPYGDLTAMGSGGCWECPYIDTVGFRYLVADCVIETTGLKIYVGQVLQSAGYSVSTAGDVTIVDFAAEKTDAVYARGQGKKVDGAVLTHPLDILYDILTAAGWDVTDGIDQTAWATAYAFVSAQNYAAAGVLIKDMTFQEIATALLGSFLGSCWQDAAGRLVVSFDSSVMAYNIRGFLAERDLRDVQAGQRLDNICNQVIAWFAPVFAKTDKRFTEGANMAFVGYNDGASTIDAASQARYGVRTREIQMAWVYDATIANLMQARLVERFANPRWLLRGVETTLRNLHVGRGEYVCFSWPGITDENQLPLRNQIGQVLTKKVLLNSYEIEFEVLDTGDFLGYPPPILDGTLIFGSLQLGGERNREILV